MPLSGKSGEVLRCNSVECLVLSAPLKELPAPGITVLVNGYPRTLPAPPAPEGVIAQNAFITSKENAPTIADAGDFERDQPFSAGLWIKLGDDKNGAIISRMDEEA